MYGTGSVSFQYFFEERPEFISGIHINDEGLLTILPFYQKKVYLTEPELHLFPGPDAFMTISRQRPDYLADNQVFVLEEQT